MQSCRIPSLRCPMIKIFILLLALISILQDLLIRHRLKKAFPERPWVHRIYLASFLLLDTLIVIALTCYRMAPDAASPRYVQIILWVIAIFMMSIVPKLIYLLFLLNQEIAEKECDKAR